MVEEAPKPIIAFREWGVRSVGHGSLERIVLAPRFRSGEINPWVHRKAEACCLEADHLPGSPGCECGLYGYFEVPKEYRQPVLEHVKPSESGRHPSDPPELIYVFGAFIGWGETSKHRDGIRSQFARPVALRWSPLAAEIAGPLGLVLADTPAELRVAGVAAGGTIFDPSTLPKESKGRQGYGLSRVRTLGNMARVGSIPISRNPMQGQTRRITCTLILTPGVSGVEVIGEQNQEGSRIRISGLDDKVWAVNSYSEKVDILDIPMVGRTRTVAHKTGRVSIELGIEALLDESKIDQEMTKLTKIGRVFKTSAEPHAGPLPEKSGPLGEILPGTSNHGWGGGWTTGGDFPPIF